MRRRIMTSTVLIILATVLVMVACTGYALQKQRAEVAQTNIRGTAAVLAGGFTNWSSYTDYAGIVSGHVGYRVTVVSPEGVLLDDSNPIASEANLLDREEYLQARLTGHGYYVRRTSNMGRVMYAVSRAADGTFIGLSGEYPSFWRILPPLLPYVGIAVLVLLALAVWFSSRMAQSIAKPMADFSLALGGVMDGGEPLEPDRYPYEELKAMALGINHLSGEVETGLRRLDLEHKKLDTILSTIQDGFVLLDWSEEVLLINDAACRILGFVRGTGYDNLVYVTRDISILDAVAEVKKTGAPRRVEYTGPGGGSYEVNVGPTSPYTSEQEPGIVLMLRDAGEGHSTAKARQDFFASASHELKTPITSVRGFAELLLADSGDSARQQEYARRILVEAQRMQTLIEEILLIARMESGEIRYEREDLDLHRLVATVCAQSEELASEKGIEIAFEGEGCRMYGSAKEIAELVGNLVSNAVKYNIPGGQVLVRLWVDDGSPILSVFNTGDAIPEPSVERIFERFYRIDKGRSKAVGGTGLGLAIAKHIASQYGAKISVHPHPGEGNTFQVIFPPSIMLAR